MVATPFSSAAALTSSSVTGMPALRKFMAIPPPMVPAPMTPTEAMLRVGVLDGTSATFEAARSAKKMWRSAFDSGASQQADEDLTLLALARFDSPAQSRPASMASRQASGAGKGPALAFTMLRANPRKASWLGYLIAHVADALGGQLLRHDLGCERLRGGQQVVRHDAIEQRRLRQVRGATGSPLTIMLTAISSPTARGSRCVPPAPGINPIFTSGRPTRAASARDPELASQRELEAAAQTGARDGGDRRFVLTLEEPDQGVQRGLGGRLRRVEFLYIGAAGKEFVRADQDHGRDGRILFRFRQLVDEMLANGMRQRIDGRIVELDDGHCVGRAGR